MHQLSEGLWTPPCFADQLSSAQSGMAPRRPRSLIRVNSRIFAAHKFTCVTREASAAPAASFKRRSVYESKLAICSKLGDMDVQQPALTGALTPDIGTATPKVTSSIEPGEQTQSAFWNATPSLGIAYDI